MRIASKASQSKNWPTGLRHSVQKLPAATTRPGKQVFECADKDSPYQIVKVCRESYGFEILFSTYICALTPVGSFAQDRLQLERSGNVRHVQPHWRAARTVWLHEAKGTHLFGALSQEEHKAKRRMAQLGGYFRNRLVSLSFNCSTYNTIHTKTQVNNHVMIWTKCRALGE